MESDNARLKRLLADAELDKNMLPEIASGTFDPEHHTTTTTTTAG